MSERGMGRIDEALAALMKKLGIEKDVARQEAVARWPEIVGPAIAEMTRARGVARGVLFVEVRSSAWISELDLMRHELLTRLNAGAGDGRVERIVFQLGGDSSFGESSGEEGRAGEPEKDRSSKMDSEGDFR